MKIKINRQLLPIKAHFFFFFAALGPLLPQMNVFGRQLGVSPGVMGLVTAVLPLLWAVAKPTFGYVVDYWPAHRKVIFMLLIAIMSGSYCCLWFLPMPDVDIEKKMIESIYRLNDTIYVKRYENTSLDKYTCHWNCTSDNKFHVYLSNSTYINTIYTGKAVGSMSCSALQMELDAMREGEVICVPKKDCNLLCFEDDIVPINESLKLLNDSSKSPNSGNHSNDLVEPDSGQVKDNFYMTSTFWAFVVAMCIGTVAFNVANCIGDAVCFDVLGPERGSLYGAQRAWGTAGYGVTALLGGWLVDSVSGSAYKDFTPAFVLALIATGVDLYSCRALTLPSLSSPDDSGKALREVLKIPRVLVFITFAVVAGTFDSFIIYYTFWFLEELAEDTGHVAKIKLIEGVVVAAQSFIGELLFFFFSGKIINRWGYGATLTFSLFCYGVRMALISFIQNPWHLVFIEGIMQGPTYALCYSTIVGYAAKVAPEGYSATVQGIVAGMDDGVGFALGSLVGGQLYSWLGGRGSFRCLAVVAGVGALAHALLFRFVTRMNKQEEYHSPSSEITQEEGQKMLSVLQDGMVYRDTVIPLEEGDR